MVVSLPKRFQKLSARQHLQCRIDLLVGSSTYPSGTMELEPNKKAWIDPFPDSEDVWDTDPIGSSDVAAALRKLFVGGAVMLSPPLMRLSNLTLPTWLREILVSVSGR